MLPLSDCRKTYITKRVVRPTPINPQKAATCAWLFALLKGGVPRWSGGRTAILSLLFCVQPARRGSAVWERRLAASAGAQYGSGGTPPAPCKNSKKWPKPLFRHAHAPASAGALLYHSACQRVKPSLMVESTLMSFSSMGSTFNGSWSTIIRSAHLPSSREPLVFSSKY